MFKHLSTILAALLPAAALGAPLTTAFTYQGQLTDAGTPPTAAYDFEFCLFGSLAGPDLVACHAPLETVPVNAGQFSVRLDFGPGAFIGDEQFLEIRVRPDASIAAFTPLAPRQAITAAPNALHALSVSADAVGSVQIANAAITNADLAANAVNTTQIANVAVTLAKLADNSVDSNKIVDGTVATVDLANGAVGAAQIANGAVGLAQINSAEVQSRISGSCALGEYFRGVNANGSVACEPVPGVQRITVIDDVPGGSLNFGTNVSIAIGSDGLPIVAYRESVQGSLRVAKCGNSACSANNVITAIDTAGDTGFQTNLAIGSDGLPTIAYVNGSSDVRFVHCGNAACSSGNTLVPIEASANTLGAGLSMVIGSDGFPVFSYGDRTALSLKFARCTTVTCAGGSVSVIELDNPANDVGIDTALTIATDGFPFIVYRDSTDGSTDVVHCGSVDCLTGNTFTPAVDLGGPGAAELNLAVVTQPAPSGPLVIYRYSSIAGLLALQCSTANCPPAGNVTTTITDAAASNFQSFSIQLGTDALPVISYFNATQGSLGLLRCGNRDCSSGDNSFATIDNAFSQVATHNALALGADGLPVIAYEHGTQGAARVVKCGSVSCQ